MPVELTVKSMKQRQVIVVLCRLFPAKTILVAKIFGWKGERVKGLIRVNTDRP